MVPSRKLQLVAMLAILALGAMASGTSARGVQATYLLEDVYTGESTTTQREVPLEGVQVVQAWFNFTVLDDMLESQPDSFTFTVQNLDDPSMLQSLPGTTDTEGRLSVPFQFTKGASPRWRATVTCTEAGDVMRGPFKVDDDPGNDWSLQVEYVYTTALDGNDGNGSGGGDGEGGDDTPTLVTLLEVNLILVALLSVLVTFLSLNAVLGDASLKLPLVIAFILLANAFLILPIAFLVNSELNDTIIGPPPYGPQWLGNLAVVLLVLWAAPFVLARQRVMGSDEVHRILARVTSRGLAERVRRRARGGRDDPLPERWFQVVMVAIGIASVATVAMMLLA